MAKDEPIIPPLNSAENDFGVIQTEITQEMQKAYLDYAMSVIVSRALPDVRDGLKPVQRRIIYAMQDQGMTSAGKFHKCAAVIGEVLKKYHPHSDTSVYDALVRMGQDWTLRYPLVFPQGNFGSIDGDPPAAMRYTECKLQRIAEELYADIDKDTVDFELNDLQNEEPTYLPSLLPNVLLNGVSGIAVGMATQIPPHNLGEVIDGINELINQAEHVGEEAGPEDITQITDDYSVKVAKQGFSSGATVEDLVKHIQGPDFPTGGIIYDQKEMMHMYATGKGRVVTRAKIGTEEMTGGRTRIVVTEIPYQINKSTLVSKIADLVKEKKIIGVADLRDESNREGLRVVVELKKDAIVKKVQNQLFKHTPLQSTFNTNMVALIDGEPKLMTLKMVLEEFVKHRQQIIIRRTIFLLKKAKAREHILLGLKIALDNIDEVIALIKKSKDAEVAKVGLMEKFGFSEIQAQHVLDMQLRKLAALERQKIEDELKQIMETIKGLETLLASPQEIIKTVQNELNDIKTKYADDRKTKVIKGALGRIGDEDLVANEPCIITISDSGYIKRLKEATYKRQGRGGKGIKGQELKEEDMVKVIRTCETHDHALFFTNLGKVYKLRIWEIPETQRTSKGTALVNFLNIRQDERVETMLTLDNDTLEKGDGFVLFGTEKGKIKKTPINDFANIRTNGIIAIKMNDDDNLVYARVTSGQDDIILTTKQGMAIRFDEEDARPMGRAAAGVTGIKLKKEDDCVVGMVAVPKMSTNLSLMVVSSRGLGKKTDLDEYKTQNRGGSGILTYKVGERAGTVVSARIMTDNIQGDLLIATESGKFIRLDEKQVPKLGRATQGVKLMNLGPGDSVISVALLTLDETISVGDEGEENGANGDFSEDDDNQAETAEN